MRVLKEHEERKKEIIETAALLFLEKGYDTCSVSDILQAVGIAKGTFYYYFKSKEEVLDAAVEQVSEKLYLTVEELAKDGRLTPIERMVHIMAALRLKDKPSKVLIEELHKGKNALLHQKTLVSILNRLTPIFTNLVEEGNHEGIFACSYPEQCMQILFSSALTLLDDGIFHFEEEKETKIIKALFYSMEKMLGVKENEISSKMLALYEKKGSPDL